jgi:5'-deoxynucleotidase YfbR-like HD superfamily hydrolase
MRLREGIVKMTCQCQRYSQEGWCRHCLAVFSNCEVFESKKHREAFEQLVGRTHLEHAATKLTKALDDFAGAYRKMQAVRPSDIDRGQLKEFAEQAYRASKSAHELAMALEKFIKEAEARDRGGDEKLIMDLPAVIAP